jgi:hypothetical protein
VKPYSVDTSSSTERRESAAAYVSSAYPSATLRSEAISTAEGIGRRGCRELRGSLERGVLPGAPDVRRSEDCQVRRRTPTFKTPTRFHDLGADYYASRIDKSRRTRNLVHQLKTLRPQGHSRACRRTDRASPPRPGRSVAGWRRAGPRSAPRSNRARCPAARPRPRYQPTGPYLPHPIIADRPPAEGAPTSGTGASHRPDCSACSFAAGDSVLTWITVWTAHISPMGRT